MNDVVKTMNKVNRMTTARKLAPTSKTKDDSGVLGKPAPSSAKNGVTKTVSKTGKTGEAPKSRLFGFRRDSQTLTNPPAKTENGKLNKTEKQGSKSTTTTTVERRSSTLPSTKPAPRVATVGRAGSTASISKTRGVVRTQTKDPTGTKSGSRPAPPSRSMSITPTMTISTSSTRLGNGTSNASVSGEDSESGSKTTSRSGLPLRRSTSLKYPQPLSDQTNQQMNIPGRNNLRKRSLVTIHQEKENRKIQQLETKSQLCLDGLTVVIQHLHSQLEICNQTLNEKLDDISSMRGVVERLGALNSSMLIQHNEQLSTTEQLHREQLDQLHNTVSAMYKTAINSLKELHQSQVKEMQEKYCKEVKNLEENISEMKAEQEKMISDLRQGHEMELQDKDSQIAESRAMYKKCRVELRDVESSIDILRDEHRSSIIRKAEEHDKTLLDMKKQHEQRLVEMDIESSRHLEMKNAECGMLRARIDEIEADLQKHIQIAVQGATDRYKDFPAEVESLKTVLHMKNSEIQELRCDNMKLKVKMEEMEVRAETVEKLHRRNQDLQALVQEKTQSEWNLSKEKVKLMHSVEKESKANKRLSMEREELLWKLYHDSLRDDTGSGGRPTTPLRSRPPSLSFSPSDQSPNLSQSWFQSIDQFPEDGRYHSLQRPTSRRKAKKRAAVIRRSKSLDSLKKQ